MMVELKMEVLLGAVKEVYTVILITPGVKYTWSVVSTIWVSILPFFTEQQNVIFLKNVQTGIESSLITIYAFKINVSSIKCHKTIHTTVT